MAKIITEGMKALATSSNGKITIYLDYVSGDFVALHRDTMKKIRVGGLSDRIVVTSDNSEITIKEPRISEGLRVFF